MVDIGHLHLSKMIIEFVGDCETLGMTELFEESKHPIVLSSTILSSKSTKAAKAGRGKSQQVETDAIEVERDREVERDGDQERSSLEEAIKLANELQLLLSQQQHDRDKISLVNRQLLSIICSDERRKLISKVADVRAQFKRDCAAVLLVLQDGKAISHQVELLVKTKLTASGYEEAISTHDLNKVMKGIQDVCFPHLEGVANDFLAVITRQWDPQQMTIDQFIQSTDEHMSRLRGDNNSPPTWEELHVSLLIMNLARSSSFHQFTQPMLADGTVPETAAELIVNLTQYRQSKQFNHLAALGANNRRASASDIKGTAHIAGTVPASDTSECFRCKRIGHKKAQCTARTMANGKPIQEGPKVSAKHDGKGRPKGSAKLTIMISQSSLHSTERDLIYVDNCANENILCEADPMPVNSVILRLKKSIGVDTANGVTMSTHFVKVPLIKRFIILSKISTNLLSFSKALECGLRWQWTEGASCFDLLLPNRELIFRFRRTPRGWAAPISEFMAALQQAVEQQSRVYNALTLVAGNAKQIPRSPAELARASEARELHLSLNCIADSTLKEMLSSGAIIGTHLTARDVDVAREAIGPCIICLAIKMKHGPLHSSRAEPARRPGERVHCDIFYILDKMFLLTVDARTDAVNGAILSTKKASELKRVLILMEKSFKRLGHAVGCFSWDREPGAVALDASNEWKFVFTEADGHEKTCERQAAVVRNRVDASAKRIQREGATALPDAIKIRLVFDVLRRMNDVPNSKTAPETPNMILKGVRGSAQDMLNNRFGKTGMFKRPGNQSRGDAADPGMIVGYEPATPTNLQVYLPQSRSVVVRKQYTPLAIPAVYEQLAAIAEEERSKKSSQQLQTSGHQSSLDLYPLADPLDRDATDQMINTESATDADVVADVETITATPNTNFNFPAASDPTGAGFSELSTPDPDTVDYESAPDLVYVDDSDSDDEDEQDIMPQPSESEQPSAVTPTTTLPTRQSARLSGKPRTHISNLKRAYISNAAKTWGAHVPTLVNDLELTDEVIIAMATSAGNLSIRDAKAELSAAAVDEAIAAELATLIRYKTWEVKSASQLSPSQLKSVVPSKLFLKLKLKASGAPDRVKARLVAGGHRQKPGTYTRTSSPTIDNAHIMLAIGIASSYDWKIGTMDIPSAYLNAPLKEEVYMRLTPEVSAILVKMHPEYEPYLDDKGTLLLKLLQALYGLKQAGAEWFEHLSSTILSIGYTQSSIDKCWFYKGSEQGASILIVHVDDLMLLSGQEKEFELFERKMKATYGDACHIDRENLQYLGMQLLKLHQGGYKISQPGYTQRSVDKYASDRRVYATPSTADFFEAQDDTSIDYSSQSNSFMSDLATVLFLATHTRPDILKEVVFLSTVAQNPGPIARKKLDRIYGYLRGTLDLGIYLTPARLALSVYTDASFAVHRNGRSHSCLYICLGDNGGPILVKSKMQPIVTTSSTEAELQGQVSGVMKAYPLWRLMGELGISTGIQVLQDNISTLTIAQGGEGYPGKSRHMRVRYQYLAELSSDGTIMFAHCPTGEMIADLGTKPIGGQVFKHLRRLMLNLPDEPGDKTVQLGSKA
jgi:hypothetical protein